MRSVNSFDTPRIQSPLNPLPQPYAAGDERTTLTVPEEQADSRESAQEINLDEANIGQLPSLEKEALMEVLKKYADVFAANPKAIAACREHQ